jgi:hypothetical protein
VFQTSVDILCSACNAISTEQFSVELEPRVRISWRIDGDVIRVGLSVKTTGWLAFGLSTSGTMLDSDAYIG